MRQLILALPLLFACAVNPEPEIDDDAWTDPGKLDDPSAGGIASTQTANARLLDGFNKLLDSTTDSCLAPVDTTPAFTVGDITKPFDLYFVSSKDDLARTLGIDVGLKVKYGTTSIGPSLDFLDSFKQTRSAIHLLLAARASYRVTNLRSVALTTQAKEWLVNDPHQFLNRCGNLFVNGAEYEAQLYVMIRIDALTEDASRSIGADLGLGAVTGPIGLDANVKAKLETIAKRNDVVVETHVLDRGFRTDGGTGDLMASLLATGVSKDTFVKVDAIREAMLKSLTNDACRDAGVAREGCSGPMPGYMANNSRDAVAVKLDLRSYSRATNAPIGGPGSSFETMRNWLGGADRTLRTLSKSALRLEAIRKDEVLAFLAAPSARKVFYGIAPPAAPVTKLDTLVALATSTRDALDPDREGSVAADLRTCFANVVEGAPDACSTADKTTDATDEAIAKYVATARIVPLRVAAKGVLGYQGARDACNAVAMRLPTFAEAQRLAIPIGYASLARTTEDRLKFAAWHSETGKCSNGDAPALSSPPGGTMQNVCTAENWLNPHPTTTLCVPAGGPFDQLLAP